MAIWPFLFTRLKRSEVSEELIRHERIHFRQQMEMLWIGFFLWYFLEFFLRWLKTKNRMTAYRNISFEREAYREEANLHYLSARKPFAWFKHYK